MYPMCCLRKKKVLRARADAFARLKYWPSGAHKPQAFAPLNFTYINNMRLLALLICTLLAAATIALPTAKERLRERMDRRRAERTTRPALIHANQTHVDVPGMNSTLYNHAYTENWAGAVISKPQVRIRCVAVRK